MSGIIFLCLFNISHFSSTCRTKNFSLTSCSTMAKRIQEQKEEEERVVSKSRLAAVNLSSSIATRSSSASSPIAYKSRGTFDAASTSQVRLKDAYLGGLKGPVAQNSKAWEQPLAHGASSSVDKGKSKGNRSDMGPQSPPSIATHIPLYGSRLLHDHGNLWKKTWRSFERFGCELGYLVNVNVYHSSSSGSSRKRLWSEFEMCKESSLENSGTASQGNRKAYQWSDRNRWRQRDWFPRFEVDVAKLSAIAQVEFINIPLPKSMFPPTSGALLRKIGDDLVESWKSKIQWCSDNKYFSELMDNLWNSSGRFSLWWENYSV